MKYLLVNEFTGSFQTKILIKIRIIQDPLKLTSPNLYKLVIIEQSKGNIPRSWSSRFLPSGVNHEKEKKKKKKKK